MSSLPPLSALGPRICILGPSNSGKSTLAQAIARKNGACAVHLDLLFHLPHTDWQPRPAEEFLALHAAAIRRESWVIDGNYTKCLPERLERATGLILLDISTSLSLFRYLRRTLFEKGRIGALEGRQDSIKLDMLRHLVCVTPGNMRRYREMFDGLTLPKAHLCGARAITRCYEEWGLTFLRSRDGG